jgi:L-aminopeptidase/D-esterase-like protein
MAQAGLARAIAPVFSPLDGDIVFALATNRQPLPDPHFALARLGALAANALARAIARAVYEARGALPDGTKSWREIFGAA